MLGEMQDLAIDLLDDIRFVLRQALFQDELNNIIAILILHAN